MENFRIFNLKYSVYLFMIQHFYQLFKSQKKKIFKMLLYYVIIQQILKLKKKETN